VFIARCPSVILLGALGRPTEPQILAKARTSNSQNRHLHANSTCLVLLFHLGLYNPAVPPRRGPPPSLFLVGRWVVREVGPSSCIEAAAFRLVDTRPSSFSVNCAPFACTARVHLLSGLRCTPVVALTDRYG